MNDKLVHPVWFHMCHGPNSNSFYSFHVEQSGSQMKINTLCIVWNRVTTVSKPWKGYTLAWKGYTLAWSRYPHKFTRFSVNCYWFIFSKQNTQHGATASFLVDLPCFGSRSFWIILAIAYFSDMILELRKKYKKHMNHFVMSQENQEPLVIHLSVHQSWSPKARLPVR